MALTKYNRVEEIISTAKSAKHDYDTTKLFTLTSEDNQEATLFTDNPAIDHIFAVIESLTHHPL